MGSHQGKGKRISSPNISLTEIKQKGVLNLSGVGSSSERESGGGGGAQRDIKPCTVTQCPAKQVINQASNQLTN